MLMIFFGNGWKTKNQISISFEKYFFVIIIGRYLFLKN